MMENSGDQKAALPVKPGEVLVKAGSGWFRSWEGVAKYAGFV